LVAARPVFRQLPRGVPWCRSAAVAKKNADARPTVATDSPRSAGPPHRPCARRPSRSRCVRSTGRVNTSVCRLVVRSRMQLYAAIDTDDPAAPSACAKKLAQRLARETPDTVTAVMAKNQRTKRVCHRRGRPQPHRRTRRPTPRPLRTQPPSCRADQRRLSVSPGQDGYSFPRRVQFRSLLKR
jgi:hypothetical protein